MFYFLLVIWLAQALACGASVGPQQDGSAGESPLLNLLAHKDLNSNGSPLHQRFKRQAGVDENGNINCTNCKNCRNCVNCNNCTNCTYCKDCNNCSGCYMSQRLSNVIECTHCTDCSNIRSCLDCHNQNPAPSDPSPLTPEQKRMQFLRRQQDEIYAKWRQNDANSDANNQ